MLQKDRDIIMECNDEQIMKKFKENGCWGMYTGINLEMCNLDLVRDADFIAKFAVDLCELIDMKRFGDPQVVHFGRDEKAGYTVIQLIETSSLVGHFMDDDGAAYIDVFSCKEYGPNEVAGFCKKYFGAEKMSYNVFLR